MIGWVLLSPLAVARAAEALASNDRGVRDEVGFQSIHQAISDRLFPGTSVLHTRARYALLVPWLMKQVAEYGPGTDLEQRLLKAEGALAGQLVRGQDAGRDAAGAIGADVWRQRQKPPAQPPSFSYWSALREWGILVRAPDGSTPRRIEVLRRLSRKASRKQRAEDDPVPDSGNASPFVRLPPPPQDLGRNSIALDLALTDDERKFLRRQLIGVLRPDGQQSLLARLVEARSPGQDEAPWDRPVADLADPEDREILRVARQAAALAAIGRGVYAALAEAARNADGHERSRSRAEALAAVRHDYATTARRLDVDELKQMFPQQLHADLLDLLRATLAWLERETESPALLRERYAAAEWRLKDVRSKLTTKLSGRRRREEWQPDKHPAPAPLGYRWRNVARLLADLA